MPDRTADVVVIGGGVTGASTAMHLARMGAGRVVLVERGGLASGASGLSSAMVREHYLHPTLVRLARESSDVFHNFKDVVGGDARFRQTGRIILFGERDWAAAVANVAMNRDLGVDIETPSLAETTDLLPQADLEGIVYVAYEPRSGYADPVATVYAYAEMARNYGAEVLTDTAVTGIRTQGGRLTAIETSSGAIATGTAVNAAGAWCNQIGDMIDERLSITPTRVEVLRLRRPPTFGPMNPAVVDYLTGTYFRTDDGDCTLVGGEAPEDYDSTIDPDGFARNITTKTMEDFWSRARLRFPQLDAAICRGGHGGIYDMSPDANPILDRSQAVDGLYWAVGFSGHGFKLSPVIGRMMAEFILHGECEGYDIREFRQNRFADGDLLVPDHPYAERAHY